MFSLEKRTPRGRNKIAAIKYLKNFQVKELLHLFHVSPITRIETPEQHILCQ